VRHVSNTALLSKKKQALCDGEEGEKHTPPIQSHYFSFSNTHTIISHHHRWKTEKKSQDADAGEGWWNGNIENESFSSSAERSFVGFVE
jgi:hypothetical protein